MKRSIIETILGAVVLIVAGVFLFFAYTSTDIRVTRGYALTANFNAIDGLTVGSDVRLGGVKIGSVSDLSIDQSVYQAVVTMMIQQRIKLPEDTLVLISSDGLLGGKYIRLEPGSAKTTLAAGGKLANTKDVVGLEELLGKVIFLVTDGDTGS
jgi:phospholipid/cholesterol/gamma-HCH transport system substrate-binding protein